MQISNLFKSKSKCFKLEKLHVKKIFEKLAANFFVELNINKTSILEYIGKNENCLLHFKDKKNCELFRLIRDNHENITNAYKHINSSKPTDDKAHELLLNYIKQKNNKENVEDLLPVNNYSNKKNNTANISHIVKLANKISNYNITDFSSLDVIKAFNEKDNLIIIHFGSLEQSNFLKIHGSYMQFHKAKIMIIGDFLDNFKVNLKKYGFKPYLKKTIGNFIWAKNF